MACFTFTWMLASAVTAAPQTGAAADTVTPHQAQLTCAPQAPLGIGGPVGFVLGDRDDRVKAMYAPPDMVLVDAGAEHGVQVGQQFLVRRRFRVGDPAEAGSDPEGGVHTAGWLRLVEVMDRHAVAVIEHACTEIVAGDYLEPYVPLPTIAVPSEPAPAHAPSGYEDRWIVLNGHDGRVSGATHDLMVVTRGAGDGSVPGQYVTFYRRAVARGPISLLGRGVVVRVGTDFSVVRIVWARDAVTAGDFVAPHGS